MEGVHGLQAVAVCTFLQLLLVALMKHLMEHTELQLPTHCSVLRKRIAGQPVIVGHADRLT